MSELPNIQQLFTARVFRIPDYQRSYSWEKSQWQDLLDDLEVLPEGKDHFTGTIVLQHQEGPGAIDRSGEAYDSFDVVDGQQRLATLIILLGAIRDSARGAGLHDLATGIDGRFIRLIDRAGQQTSKVTFSDGSQPYFERLVVLEEPGPGGPSMPGERRLRDAVSFYRDALDNRRADDGDSFPERLEDLHSKVAHRLRVNIYEVETTGEVGVIFEVMNNRGRPLSELDLLKNYILYVGTKLDLEEHRLDEEVVHSWKSVFVNLMAAGLGRATNEDQLLRAFWFMAYDHNKKTWNGSRSFKRQFNLKDYQGRHEELLRDLRACVSTLADASVAYCDAYQPTRDGAFGGFQGEPARRIEVIRLSDCLVRMNVIAGFLPLLMAVRLREPANAELYRDVLQLCEQFAFRVYRLRGSRSDTGQSTLAKLGNEFYRGVLDVSALIAQLQGSLLYYSPEAEFRAEFDPDPEVNDWYHWSGLKYFLFEYERERAGVEDLGISWPEVQAADPQKTIEHILPQTPDLPYWQERFTQEEIALLTHDLGNLCLTRDNSSYGKKAFPDKKGAPGADFPCYANSALQMERDLAAFSDWDHSTIEERRTTLIAWAQDRWGLDAQASGRAVVEIIEPDPSPSDPSEDST